MQHASSARRFHVGARAIYHRAGVPSDFDDRYDYRSLVFPLPPMIFTTTNLSRALYFRHRQRQQYEERRRRHLNMRATGHITTMPARRLTARRGQLCVRHLCRFSARCATSAPFSPYRLALPRIFLHDDGDFSSAKSAAAPARPPPLTFPFSRRFYCRRNCRISQCSKRVVFAGCVDKSYQVPHMH